MKFQITSPFGALEQVRDNAPHTGIDVGMPMDTPLRSICDGIVTKAVKFGHDKIGNEVVIQDNHGVSHIYGHLDKVDVLQGQHIQAGQLIGLSGQSGHATGPHLHYGEMTNGHFIDPTNHINLVMQMAGGSAIVNHSQSMFEGMIWDFLHAVQDVALQLIDSTFLVTSGCLILASALGWKKGKTYLWLLFGARIILKFVLGGYI